jgi:hypothetical protein
VTDQKRVPITLRHPGKACARIKLWFVGDEQGRKRDAVEVWGPLPNEVVGLLRALCFAIVRPAHFSTKSLEQAAALAKELMTHD